MPTTTMKTTPCPAGTTHRRKSQLAAHERREIRALAADGKRPSWIASHYGLPVTTIHTVLRRTTRKPTPPPSKSEAVSA